MKMGCSSIKKDAVSKEEEQEQSQKFRYDCENFARIAKISQP